MRHHPVTREHVLLAADSLTADGPSQWGDGRFYMIQLVAEVARRLERTPRSVDRAVRALVRNLRDEIGEFKRGTHTTYERYSNKLRTAWQEADTLAAVLGGEAHHRVNEDEPAVIVLTLVQARTLVEEVDHARVPQARLAALRRRNGD